MNNAFNQTKEKSLKTFMINIAIALVGVAFVGFGIAFNSAAMLGNDAVAILYDGVRDICGLPMDSLGIVTNVVNYGIIVIAFLLNRRYINIGTFIYTIPMGTFVGIGSKIYEALNFPLILEFKILSSVAGCLMLFIGLGIFIAIDIGLDPFTALAMILKDKINSQYKTAKIICDLSSLAIGFTLGGKAGIVTVMAALFGGPIIQFVSEVVKKSVLIHIKVQKQHFEYKK
ncbi:YczE/YyaS/YitT family protein [Clostridium chromiireducens]|uniref:YczE/YyaS/YitT family protein n=1 Tax=Clostridium chromiireducens TaxID=225345 RepID=UPI003AF9977F